MGIDVHDFTSVRWTGLMTLYGRALDSRAPVSVLHDDMADDLVGRIDYDFAALRVDSLVWAIAVRAKRHDDVVRAFLEAHPDAVVVDLGAGLDTRMHRLAPPSTVDWYDVDFPDVVELRAGLFPADPRAHVVGADIREPGWLTGIPADRPTIVVADGLAAWFSDAEVRSLLTRLTDHFASGEIVFNEYGRMPAAEAWVGRHYGPPMLRAAVSASPYKGFDDPRLPERWIPRLRLVQELSTSRAPEVALLPPFMRAVFRLSARSERTFRKTRILHYRF
ncbi:class I SAM-dependent methyltransferase [Umezawaea sp. Da 62-37]|uniref:class I SAM-dependent methyltransferase n=1 Tax=Umezawaea sp. Da 62-37 TaxID=3075927 RepID=UPI0028F74B37|nr:class I SAM-dependent methyltransferase [Umezawaea sp. Da 62-37]WNV88731.1 class I SAM-dependent methyltransferase [Umezawaea sp. Da 62-37]